MFDFSSLWTSFYGQAFILLAIVAVVIIIVGVVTQGVGKAIGAGVAVFIIGALLVCLNNMQAISEWLTNTFITIEPTIKK